VFASFSSQGGSVIATPSTVKTNDIVEKRAIVASSFTLTARDGKNVQERSSPQTTSRASYQRSGDQYLVKLNRSGPILMLS
jgi:hypothetical protein